MTVEEFNSLSKVEAERALEKCCGTRAWIEKMLDLRPYRTREEIFSTASVVWKTLSTADWKEAFLHHPRIGGMDELRKKFGSTATWASEEQKGVASASESVLRDLADGNARYEKRYGHIFLVCATGKTASEMLSILDSRMKHSPEHELEIAAGEQEKITQLRLEKLFV
jgi:2-oxo-4-hydroxy-4-carboxy-5-ureidoimidazoline decarboxylase